MWFLSPRRPVGCLGKVPFSPDYDLEARLGGGAEAALGEWLHCIPPPESAPRPSEGFAFLLRDPSRRGAIAGRLWPSADSAGRAFPFAVYLGLGRKELQGGTGAAVERLEPAWKALEFLASDGGRYWPEIRGTSPVDLAAARDRLRKAQIPLGEWRPSLPADLVRRMRELEAWPFLSSLFPGDTAARSAAAFLRLARFLRNLDGVEQPRFALVAPYGPGLAQALQVTFWMEWINGGRDGAPLFPEAIFLPRGSCGGLWLVFRDLLPQDGGPLLYGLPPHQYVFDLTGRSPPGEEDAAAETRLGEKICGARTAGDLLAVTEEAVERPVRG